MPIIRRSAAIRQKDVLLCRARRQCSTSPSSPIGSGEKTPSTSPATAGQPSASASASEARAGHLVYKILATELKPYATGDDGKASQWALRVSLRITETMDIADYVDRQTIRLRVEGAELLPQNSFNVAIYAKGMAKAEALFVFPAPVNRVELLVGRNEDATAKIPIEIQP